MRLLRNAFSCMYAHMYRIEMNFSSTGPEKISLFLLHTFQLHSIVKSFANNYVVDCIITVFSTIRLSVVTATRV